MSDIAFGAVWRPGTGTQWVRWGMSGDEFKAQDTTYFNQGLRVTCLEIEGGKIAAVWRPGPGTQWVLPGVARCPCHRGSKATRVLRRTAVARLGPDSAPSSRHPDGHTSTRDLGDDPHGMNEEHGWKSVVTALAREVTDQNRGRGS